MEALYKSVTAEGKKWDGYKGTPCPSDFPQIDVTGSVKKGVWTWFTVTVVDARGTRELARSAVSFWKLHRSLELDKRFFKFPSPTRPRVEKQARMRDFLIFLRARSLSAKDRGALLAFLGEDTHIEPATEEPECEESGEGPRHGEEKAEDDDDEKAGDGEDEKAGDGEDEKAGGGDAHSGSMLESRSKHRRESEHEVGLLSAGPPEDDGDDKIFVLPDVSDPTGVRVIHDVPYRAVEADEQAKMAAEEEGLRDETLKLRMNSCQGKNLLDIYIPDDEEKVWEVRGGKRQLPVVIHMHGGGWVRGDRKDVFRGHHHHYLV